MFAAPRNGELSGLGGIESRLTSGNLSSVELTRHYLDRITRLDGALHSYVNVLRDQALSDAQRSDSERAQGRVRGPLHGIPFAIKDVYDAGGVATTAGSPAYIDCIAACDATIVAKLRASGAVLLGKLATHELTHGGVDFGLPWPPARNPWNLDFDPGGSSSGAGVAVAADLCAFALGTDTGGSIRKPAGMCGIAGLKPTFGRVSRKGVVLNATSLDHCGPMAHSAADCALVMQTIAGYDPLDPFCSSNGISDYVAALELSIQGRRIGIVSHFWAEDLPVPSDIVRSIEQAIDVFKRLGAHTSDVRLKPIAEYTATKLTIQQYELFATYGREIQSRRNKFGPNIRYKMDDYETITIDDYKAAKLHQRELTADMLRAMGDVDVLVTAGPGPAAPIAEVAARSGPPVADLTLPFNLTGFPSIATCVGFTNAGLPYSIQVIGRPFEENLVLCFANAYERETQWHLLRPKALETI